MAHILTALLSLVQEVRRRNPHPLTYQPQRHCQQPEHSHDHSKDPERLRRARTSDPVRDEESPSKSYHSSDDGGHDEAIAVQRLVGVDDLANVRAASKHNESGNLHS